MIEQGIHYIISNESHFMLINSLYLMANITEVIKQNNTQLAIKSYDIFNAFIHERDYETVNEWKRSPTSSNNVIIQIKGW